MNIVAGCFEGGIWVSVAVESLYSFLLNMGLILDGKNDDIGSDWVGFFVFFFFYRTLVIQVLFFFSLAAVS